VDVIGEKADNVYDDSGPSLGVYGYRPSVLKSMHHEEQCIVTKANQTNLRVMSDFLAMVPFQRVE
jgi:hypothetical protein